MPTLAQTARLSELRRECSTDDWDGNGSPTIDPESFAAAVHVLDGISRYDPVIRPGGEGDISFMWNDDTLKCFVMVWARKKEP